MPLLRIVDLAEHTDLKPTDALPVADLSTTLTKKTTTADILRNAPAGTVGAPAFSFDGDTNTGIYNPGGDQLGLVTNGTLQLLINSTGVVGITTLGSAATPAMTLIGDPNTGWFSPAADHLSLASAGVEGLRLTSDQVVFSRQTEPPTVSTTSTLTIANLKVGIIRATGHTGNITLTLPTGTNVEGGFTSPVTDMAWEWSLINESTLYTVTLATNTGHAVVGKLGLAVSESAQFRTRRTGSNAYTTYRLS